MNATHTASSWRNPFATRHTRPGRLVPRDHAGTPLDLVALAARARGLGAAAIEGPHGSGKTNLLTALAAELAAAGLHAGTLRVRSRREGPATLAAVRGARPGTMLCIDSWEALGAAWSLAVRWMARLRCVGLIVTSHRAAGLPVLFRCTTTPALLARLVADLPAHAGLIAADDIAEAHRAHGGDVREALYDLYDRFERRSRSG